MRACVILCPSAACVHFWASLSLGSQCRSYPTPWHEKPYLLHLGLQCYDRSFLREYCRLPPTPLQAGRAGSCRLLAASCFAVDGVWHGPGRRPLNSTAAACRPLC